MCSGTPPVDLRLLFDGLLETDAVPLASTEASEVAGGADEFLVAISPSSGAESAGWTMVSGASSGSLIVSLTSDSIEAHNWSVFQTQTQRKRRIV